MPKIKEIRKIEPKIKEIKKEKTEDLEEEISEEEQEDFKSFISGRRRIESSTLVQSEIPQNNPQLRERRIAKEDESEINFRPSYTGNAGNPYASKTYTPVGSAESSTNRAEVGTRGFGETTLEPRRDLQPNAQSQNSDNQWRGAGNMETAGERSYASQQDQSQSERKRKNNM